MAGNPDKFVLIATGGKLPPDTLDFAPMAKARMVELVIGWNGAIGKKKPPFTLPATVRFVQFDFEAGKVFKHDHLFPDKGTKDPSSEAWPQATGPDTIGGGGAIDDSVHDQNNSEITAKTLSITNVYNTARRCGSKAVLEISIFSHAFVEGPVLINTSDESGSKTDRDPKDVDGRTKDFNASMGKTGPPDALQTFVNNFDPSGHFRVYGCNVQDVVGNIHIVGAVVTGGVVRASNVVTITTTTSHGLLKGERVTISGVADSTFNGRFIVTDVPSATTFKFAQNGADATSGIIGGLVSISISVFGNFAANGAVRKSNVVTITTTTKHGLKKDNKVRIREVANESFNGLFTVSSVPTKATFTFAQSGTDATSGGGIATSSPGTNYKRTAAFQVIDQAFRVPSRGKPLTAMGADLRKGKPPTGSVVLDMWAEVMNEAERDVRSQAHEEARFQRKPFAQWETIENAAWAATPTNRRNKAANELLMMHRQVDPDFYPAPNITAPTSAPAQKTVTKTWADVLALCAKKMVGGYIFTAAAAFADLNSTVTFHGAVPGVGGNAARDPRQDALMRVCVVAGRFGCDDGFGEWLTFYQEFFFRDSTTGTPVKNALDERNYAQLNGDMVKLVKKLVGP
jgi:hypothetical protein